MLLALIFIRDSLHLDFVRVRNLLTAEDVSFAVTSEYTDAFEGPADGARARSIFADGRKRVLAPDSKGHRLALHILLSPKDQDRRNVREVHFYTLPDHHAERWDWR